MEMMATQMTLVKFIKKEVIDNKNMQNNDDIDNINKKDYQEYRDDGNADYPDYAPR